MAALAEYALKELEGEFAARSVETWRARCVLEWLYRRNADSFEAMTDLPLSLRASLARDFQLLSSRVKDRWPSPDGTTKVLVELAGGDVVEAVLIPEAHRRTACLSTQVGCPVRCTFCASGLEGLKRNLSAGEILEQALYLQRSLPPGERISSVVVMGIGEPLLNFPALVKALRALKAGWGLGIGYHRITLSTVGVLGRIRDLIREGVTPNLAVSLHAPNDALRADLVPVLENVRIADLIRAALEYKLRTHKQVTFEYVLLDTINDARRHALELGKKLRGTRLKVNVIPYNRVEGLPYRAPDPERVDRFVQALGGCGVPVTVRKRKGDEVSAACGQLRAQFKAALNT